MQFIRILFKSCLLLAALGTAGELRAQGVAGPVDCFTEIDPLYTLTDVNSLIKINDQRELLERRAALIRYIWGDAGFPATKLPRPESVMTDVASPLVALPNLGRVDQITLETPLPAGARVPEIKSVVYHFRPRVGSDRLMIFHEGHDPGASPLAGRGQRETIAQFLLQGYEVLALQMPLIGHNAVPPYDSSPDPHGELGALKGHGLNPLKFFVEPVAVALNHATRSASFEQIVMVGLSGGGWTTTLYAAIDPRVQVSVPVAGSLPDYLRAGPCGNDPRDWEQAEISTFIDYTELYVLGAHGEGRAQLQVLNQYDDCCYAGVRYRTYEPVVRERLARIGAGEFRVLLDGTHRGHVISPAALGEIGKAVNAPFPVLLTEADTLDAIALDSVTMMRGPFRVAATRNFSQDGRTRIMLFAGNINPDGGDAQAVEVRAEDAAQRSFPLKIEYIGSMPQAEGLTQIVVSLAEELEHAGEVRLSVRVRGRTSARGLITIR